MTWNEIADTACPIARSLAVVGDRWTLLILRELFLRQRRFEDIQAQTGMSPHLLATRLKRLEADGVITRAPYSDRPVRHAYRLTEKGSDFYPVLLGLKAWGEKWARAKAQNRPEKPAVSLRHVACGGDVSLAVTCSTCVEPVGPRDVAATLSEDFAREREERRQAFHGRRRAR